MPIPNKPNLRHVFALPLSIDSTLATFAKLLPFFNLSNIAIASLYNALS
jgi:hypothetical protein